MSGVVSSHGRSSSRILGHGGVHPLELRQLLLEGSGHLGGPLLLRRRLPQPLDVGIRAVAQLVLDRAHLLLEVVIALLLVDLLLHALLNRVLELGQLLLADQDLEQLAGAGQQPGRLEQRLPVFVGQLHIRADEVDDPALRVDVLDGESRLLGHRGRNVDDAERRVADRVDQRLELDALRVGRRVAQGLDPRLEVGFRRDVFANLDLLQSVQDHREVAVGHLEDLDDAGRRAHPVHVGRGGVVHVALALQHGAQHAARGIHGAHERNALVAADGDGSDGAREEHRRTQRQDREHLRNVGLLDRFVLPRYDRNHAVPAVGQFGRQRGVVDLDRFYFRLFTHDLSN